MPQKIEALVKPDLLLWARRTRGYSREVAAQRLSIKPELLEAWETGETRPTVAQLRKAADVYRRPLAAFFLPTPPADPSTLPDFRRSRSETLSPDFLLELRRARRRRRVASELAPVGRARLPRVDLLHDDAEGIGPSIREALGISLQSQSGWKDERAALNHWIDAVEAVGVLVFQFQRVDVDEVRGFSVRDERFPAIALNGSDSARARSFTLMHELVHLAAAQEGMCDPFDPPAGNDEAARIERACDSAAAAALIPRADLMERATTSSTDEAGLRTELPVLANRYWVSQQALLLRLITLGRATWDSYRALRSDFEEGFDRKETEPSKGGPSFFVMRVRDNGPAFTRIVLDAVRRDAVTPTDACDYLGVQVDHLPRLESVLDRRAAAE